MTFVGESLEFVNYHLHHFKQVKVSLRSTKKDSNEIVKI